MNPWYKFILNLGWPFFTLYHPMKVVGQENIPEGGCLVCANHSSMSDPCFVVVAFSKKRQLHIMAKASVMRIPILGPLLKKAGIFGIERGKADFNAIKTAMKLLKDGKYVLMFPEGTRVRENDNIEAKNGAAMLAVRAGVPILPVYIPVKKPAFRRLTVVIGEPYHIETETRRPSQDDYHRYANELLYKIYKLGENQ